jgi:polyhydroxybutyrate depolymerase
LALRIVPLLLLGACTAHVAELQEREFRLDGARRTYRLYVPTSARRPAPVVIALHRFMEDGALMAKLTGLNEVADREGFVAVYPDGPWHRFEAWDSTERDDVALVLAVLEDVAAQVRIDRRRVYLTGASNGGFLTHRLACLRPDVFAAAAPVMALMPRDVATRVPDGAPVPILIIHGTKDRIVREQAELAVPFKKYAVLPMEETVRYWVRRNRSRPRPVTIEYPDRDPEDGTRVVLHRYPAQEDGAETLFFRVRGGGHTWPGGNERAPGFIVGKTSRDLSASEVIWAFFERQRLRKAPPEIE